MTEILFARQSQSIATYVNDTNVTLSFANNTLTAGWQGTLAAGRLNANVVQAITNDTNVTGSISAQNLTLGWTGTLSIARGGTGGTGPTSAQQVLNSSAAGAASWTTTPTIGALAIGATGVSMTAANASYTLVDTGTSYVYYRAEGGGDSNGFYFGQNGSVTPLFGGTRWGFIVNNEGTNGGVVIGSNGTVHIYDYPSGGIYIGNSPTDPGANNLTVQNNLVIGPSAPAAYAGVQFLCHFGTNTNFAVYSSGTTIVIQSSNDSGGSTNGITLNANLITLQGNLQMNTNAIYGATTAAGTLTLQSTSNVTPSGDSVSVVGSSITLHSITGTAVVNIGVIGGDPGQLVIASPVNNGVTIVPASSATGTQTLQSATDTFVYRATTDTLTNKTITSSTNKLGGVTMTLGSDAVGDMYYGGTSNVLTRLAAVATGSVLGSQGVTTAPAWLSAITLSGAILTKSVNGIGYATGAGSTVTQLTSRTTGVTINSASGAITLFSAAGTASYQSFTVTNSSVAATDTIIVHMKSSSNTYAVFVTAVAAGSFQITFAAVVGTATDSPVINFSIIKGVTS